MVAAWLNRLILGVRAYRDFYDVALRDFGLMLGALMRARLAWHYEHG